jgi:hypothetical protein
MREFDTRACAEILSELILEEGQIVYSLQWDSGGPAAGGGYEVVYKFRGYYWTHSDYEGLQGPYPCLNESLSAAFTTVTDVTESIRCSELSSEEIVERLEPHDLEYTKRIVINGEDWVVTPEGDFMKKSISRSKNKKLIKLYE